MTIQPKKPKPSKGDETAAYELVTIRDAETCQRCRRSDCGTIARDHRQNRQSGNTVVENLQLLGMLCHQWKTEHPDEANREGWGAPRWAVPADYPARRWIRTDHGTLRPAWVLYVPLEQWGEFPLGWREIGDIEAARRRAGLAAS